MANTGVIEEEFSFFLSLNVLLTTLFDHWKRVVLQGSKRKECVRIESEARLLSFFWFLLLWLSTILLYLVPQKRN